MGLGTVKHIFILFCLFAIGINAWAVTPVATPGLNTEDFDQLDRTRTSATPASVTPASVTPVPVTEVSPPETKKTEGSWNNNPFARPLDNGSVQDLVLYAIIYRKGDSAALINGQIVREGDSIGLAKVIDITETQVIVQQENEVFKLHFTGGTP